MASGRPPRTLSEAALSDLLTSHSFGTLATIKRNGYPHLTTMIYGWDASTKVVRFFTTADRVKVRHAAWPSARMIAAILRWPHAGQSDAYLAASASAGSMPVVGHGP